MGKQWVDITTIDNNTPFMKVRWRKYFANQNRNYWFSELPGLETDEMSWRDGTKEYGWFSAHRMNGGTAGVFYSASFNFDHTASGYWNEAGKNYRVSLQDGDRDQYYDTAVTINGETYYEVDFSLWRGASEYKLYSPYATTPYGAGDIYVEIDAADPIVVDKDKLSFKSSGETQNVVVASDNPWTATTSEAWVTLSTSAGTSGETTLSVTAPEYTSTTEDRKATITITDGEFSVTINVKQKKYSVGVSEMYLGTLNMEAAYFGGLEVEAIYLGENEVYSSGPFTGLVVKPASKTLSKDGGTFDLKIKSSEDWALSMDSTYLSADAYSGTTGESIVTITAAANTGDTDIVTTITAVTSNYTAETTVSIRDTVDYSTKYLTMKANSAGNIVWIVGASGTPKTISYSLDSGSTWSSITSTTNGVSIPVSAGDEVLFKGTNERYQTNGNDISAYRNAFQITDCDVEVEGNIMSMIYGDNFENQTSLSSYALTNFFFSCSGITSVENLVLPATSLGTNCYEQLFYNCTGITKAPVLPAATLSTLSYAFMFQSCRTLNYVKCLASNMTAASCTLNWLDDVAATGTFVKASGSTWDTGKSGIPSGWTVIEE